MIFFLYAYVNILPVSFTRKDEISDLFNAMTADSDIPDCILYILEASKSNTNPAVNISSGDEELAVAAQIMKRANYIYSFFRLKQVTLSPHFGIERRKSARRISHDALGCDFGRWSQRHTRPKYSVGSYGWHIIYEKRCQALLLSFESFLKKRSWEIYFINGYEAMVGWQKKYMATDITTKSA